MPALKAKPQQDAKLIPERQRAIDRMRGSMAVWSKEELADEIWGAGSAALRLDLDEKDHELKAVRDVLWALSRGLWNGDGKLLRRLQRPALAALAAEAEAKTDGSATDPDAHFRIHGGKQRFGKFLIEIASIAASTFSKDTDFADFVSQVATRWEYRDVDQAEFRKKLMKRFKGGPSGDPEADAIAIATVLCGNAKKGRNLVAAASDQRVSRAARRGRD